jgi:hypothetical protein
MDGLLPAWCVDSTTAEVRRHPLISGATFGARTGAARREGAGRARGGRWRDAPGALGAAGAAAIDDAWPRPKTGRCGTLRAMALQERLRAARGEGSRSEGRGPSLRRWDLVAAWLVILLPPLTIATALAVRQRIGDLEERIVRDANALFSRTHPRALHVDAPVGVTMGDLARPHLRSLAAAEKRLGGELAKAREVVSGTSPLGALPSSMTVALAELGPELDAVLHATRAARADFPDALDPGEDGEWVHAVQLAALLAGVRMRVALAAGDPTGAVRDGLDGLALGRDVAIAGGLVGRMMGAAIDARLAAVVSTAVGALPTAAERRDALRRLRIIRDAVPPFSSSLADEMVLAQLAMGDALSERARSALDPRPRAALGDGLRDAGWWTRLAMRDGWRDLCAAQDELVAAADLPDGERAVRWTAVTERLKKVVNPLPAISLPSYERFARRADASFVRLDTVVLAAAAGVFRDARGRWPGSVEELASAGTLDPAESARLRKAELTGDRDSGSLTIVAQLPRPDDKAPRELRLRLEGRGGARD